MSIIACLCAIPRDDCQCYHCQTVRLRKRLSEIVHIVRWYESIIQEMGDPTELDDYHRGYLEALTYVIRDIGQVVKESARGVQDEE